MHLKYKMVYNKCPKGKFAADRNKGRLHGGDSICVGLLKAEKPGNPPLHILAANYLI